jgi:head-tail adaptor
MRAGDLIHRITILKPSETTDDSGQRAFEVWKSNIPARVGQASGREYRSNDRTADVRSVDIGLRFLPGLLGNMRVQWTPPKSSTAQTLEIQQVLNPDGKGIDHKLVCTEVANG